VSAGDLVLAPVSAVAALAGLELPVGSRRLLACPVPEAVDRASDFDEQLAWSALADGPTALTYADEVGAARVFVTGPGASQLAGRLGSRSAGVLGPPQQMSLF